MNLDIENSISFLKQGKTILYPTDTVWGIGCDATDNEAVKTIFNIKKRNESKSLVVLVNSEEMLEQYIPNITEKALKILQQTEKPTTIVFQNPNGLAKNVVAQDNTVAVRLVREPFCDSLIKAFGKPIVSTSANISGEKTPENFSQISEDVKNRVDYIVHWRQDDIEKSKASAIIRIFPDGSIETIRP